MLYIAFVCNFLSIFCSLTIKIFFPKKKKNYNIYLIFAAFLTNFAENIKKFALRAEYSPPLHILAEISFF